MVIPRPFMSKKNQDRQTEDRNMNNRIGLTLSQKDQENRVDSGSRDNMSREHTGKPNTMEAAVEGSTQERDSPHKEESRVNTGEHGTPLNKRYDVHEDQAVDKSKTRGPIESTSTIVRGSYKETDQIDRKYRGDSTSEDVETRGSGDIIGRQKNKGLEGKDGYSAKEVGGMHAGSDNREAHLQKLREAVRTIQEEIKHIEMLAAS